MSQNRASNANSPAVTAVSGHDSRGPPAWIRTERRRPGAESLAWAARPLCKHRCHPIVHRSITRSGLPLLQGRVGRDSREGDGRRSCRQECAGDQRPACRASGVHAITRRRSTLWRRAPRYGGSAPHLRGDSPIASAARWPPPPSTAAGTATSRAGCVTDAAGAVRPAPRQRVGPPPAGPGSPSNGDHRRRSGRLRPPCGSGSNRTARWIRIR